jgi:hypothetical protein
MSLVDAVAVRLKDGKSVDYSTRMAKSLRTSARDFIDTVDREAIAVPSGRKRPQVAPTATVAEPVVVGGAGETDFKDLDSKIKTKIFTKLERNRPDVFLEIIEDTIKLEKLYGESFDDVDKTLKALFRKFKEQLIEANGKKKTYKFGVPNTLRTGFGATNPSEDNQSALRILSLFLDLLKKLLNKTFTIENIGLSGGMDSLYKITIPILNEKQKDEIIDIINKSSILK